MQISNAASKFRNLNEEQLDTPYRQGGWTIRQMLHHLVDSHMNSYIRFKWALTEEEPVIKAYFEERWAELHIAHIEELMKRKGWA